MRDERRSQEVVLHGDVYNRKTVTAGNISELIGDGAFFTPGTRHGSQDFTQKDSGYTAVGLLDNPNSGYT